jgi:serine protease Do
VEGSWTKWKQELISICGIAPYDPRRPVPDADVIHHRIFYRTFLPALLLCCGAGAHADQEAKAVFGQTATSVYQILIIEAESGNKSAIGSGFQIAGTDLIATNFHVISGALHKPDNYHIEYLDSAGKRDTVQLVEFDVIHDLALLRRTAAPDAGIRIAPQEVVKGESVYALGNPFDLGQTIVPGTFNGLLERSFYQKLLFSGSLNPGMSGGPSLNESGELIGINVATSGNQISFLVPAKYLNALLEKAAARTRPLVAEDYQSEVAAQLYADQEYKFALLLNIDWPTQQLGEMKVAGEVSAYFKCWGNTNHDQKLLFRLTESACTSEDTIFLSDTLQTGAIDYQYGWATSDELGSLRFHRLLTDSYARMLTRNQAGEDDVTNYQCHTGFVAATDDPDQVFRTVQCVRQYKKYPQLFDVLFLSVQLGADQQSLSSHFALSGVSRENAESFTRKFMALTTWDS